MDAQLSRESLLSSDCCWSPVKPQFAVSAPGQSFGQASDLQTRERRDRSEADVRVRVASGNSAFSLTAQHTGRRSPTGGDSVWRRRWWQAGQVDAPRDGAVCPVLANQSHESRRLVFKRSEQVLRRTSVSAPGSRSVSSCNQIPAAVPCMPAAGTTDDSI